ncbi:beta-Ala-His dipeptidase [Thermoproteota archaeon]
MADILQGLDPEPVWQIFEEISKIPRCSKNEEKLQAYLKKWATENNILYKKDSVGNFLLTREATKGFDWVPTLMFQAHQDMVCVKTPESNHDFNKDPIPLELQSGKVTAHNTSLGADNGVGMALAMALLIDENLTGNGRIEALFTVDEEAGFSGVRNLKPDFFTATHMINLDSEEVGVIIVSSAGGGGTTYSIKFRAKSPDIREGLRIEVSGLLGGHSGVDIHLPRYNANKLLAEGLKGLHSKLPIRLIKFEGGTRGNVIPRDAYADILVLAGHTEKAAKIIDDWAGIIDKSTERGIDIKTRPIKARPAAPIFETEKVINLVSEIPFGPKSWSKEYEGLVQTSNNNGIIKTEESTFKIMVNSRTSDMKDFYDNQRILTELGNKYQVRAEQRSEYSGWKADPNSKLVKLVKKSYGDVLGKKPKVTGIHGGLECGVIAGLKPGINIVSVGPTIKYPHSPFEYVKISSVDTLYKTLLIVAEKMSTL